MGFDYFSERRDWFSPAASINYRSMLLIITLLETRRADGQKL